MTYDVGVGTYTYREFSIEGLCDALADTPVSAVDLYTGHIGPDDDLEDVEAAAEHLDAAGLDVCGWSAPDADDPSAIEAGFERIDVLEPSYLMPGSGIEDPDVAEVLIDEAEARDVLLGVHNHGPDPWSDFGPVEEVLDVIEGYPPVVGACVDTGHYLRNDQEPAHVIPALGDRVHAVHIKDYVDEGGDVMVDEATEVVPGDGRLDLAELVDLLGEHTNLDQPLVVEYEQDPEDPTPAVVETANRLDAAMD